MQKYRIQQTYNVGLSCRLLMTNLLSGIGIIIYIKHKLSLGCRFSMTSVAGVRTITSEVKATINANKLRELMHKANDYNE